jgi:hypothetical protein
MRDRQSWLDRLAADGFVEPSGIGVRLTRRWHAAFTRAAFRGFEEGGELDDIRTPIAVALVESYGDLDDAEFAAAIGAILSLVMAEMLPQPAASRGR